MATRLQIINGALARLGEDRVQSLPATIEFDPNADDLASDVYDIYFTERDALLDATPWSWLTERYQLPASQRYVESTSGVFIRGPVPPNETLAEGERFTNKRQDEMREFQLRNPRVASVRALFDTQTAERSVTVGWTRQGQYIYANLEQAWVDDQRQVAEEVFPNLFVRALSLKLTAEMAMQITEDVPSARYWDQKAQAALQDAQRVDAQSKPAEGITDFEWRDFRISGTYGYTHTAREIEGLSRASRAPE